MADELSGCCQTMKELSFSKDIITDHGDSETQENAQDEVDRDPDYTEERFKVDRRKLEHMIQANEGNGETAEDFFVRVMEETNTQISWPSKLKIGAKSKKDPHIKVSGHYECVNKARDRIMAILDTKSTRVTLKMDVSHTEHSHVIGKAGNNIKRVMTDTGCHIHFPDSNRSNQAEKSNQVSIAGQPEGVEEARVKIRELLPLVFMFELPLAGLLQPPPDQSTPTIQHIQNTYGVIVTFKQRPRSYVTIVTIRGSVSESKAVKEATAVLIEHLTGNIGATVPVSMQLDIAPQHHLFIIGRGGANIKQIMQRTGASIHFPDPATASGQRRGTVYITGAIESVYLARQHLIGCLPLVLMFDMKEDIDIGQGDINQLMEHLDVFVSIKPKPKQPSKSVIVKSIERNAANLYDARNRLLSNSKELLCNNNNSHEANSSSSATSYLGLSSNISQLGGGSHKLLGSSVLMVNGLHNPLPSNQAFIPSSQVYSPVMMLTPGYAVHTMAHSPAPSRPQLPVMSSPQTQPTPSSLPAVTNPLSPALPATPLSPSTTPAHDQGPQHTLPSDSTLPNQHSSSHPLNDARSHLANNQYSGNRATGQVGCRQLDDRSSAHHKTVPVHQRQSETGSQMFADEKTEMGLSAGCTGSSSGDLHFHSSNGLSKEMLDTLQNMLRSSHRPSITSTEGVSGVGSETSSSSLPSSGSPQSYSPPANSFHIMHESPAPVFAPTSEAVVLPSSSALSLDTISSLNLSSLLTSGSVLTSSVGSGHTANVGPQLSSGIGSGLSSSVSTDRSPVPLTLSSVTQSSGKRGEVGGGVSLIQPEVSSSRTLYSQPLQTYSTCRTPPGFSSTRPTVTSNHTDMLSASQTLVMDAFSSVPFQKRDVSASDLDKLIERASNHSNQDDESLFSNTNVFDAIDYDQKKKLANKAMQQKPSGETRLPTDLWAGYGFSKSMPDSAIRDRLKHSNVRYQGPTMSTTFELGAESFNGDMDSDPWKETPAAKTPPNMSPSSSFTTSTMPCMTALPPTPFNAVGDYRPLGGTSLEGDSQAVSKSGRSILGQGATTPQTGSVSVTPGDHCDLHDLFSSLGLSKYAELFQQQEIDLSTFVTLTDADLRELGISTFGARRKMLLAITDLQKKQSLPPSVNKRSPSPSPFTEPSRRGAGRGVIGGQRRCVASHSGRW